MQEKKRVFVTISEHGGTGKTFISHNLLPYAIHSTYSDIEICEIKKDGLSDMVKNEVTISLKSANNKKEIEDYIKELGFSIILDEDNKKAYIIDIERSMNLMENVIWTLSKYGVPAVFIIPTAPRADYTNDLNIIDMIRKNSLDRHDLHDIVMIFNQYIELWEQEVKESIIEKAKKDVIKFIEIEKFDEQSKQEIIYGEKRLFLDHLLSAEKPNNLVKKYCETFKKDFISIL